MPDIEFESGKWKKGCEFAKYHMQTSGINITEYLMSWPGLDYEENYISRG
jgi:hypothetical protein